MPSGPVFRRTTTWRHATRQTAQLPAQPTSGRQPRRKARPRRGIALPNPTEGRELSPERLEILEKLTARIPGKERALSGRACVSPDSSHERPSVSTHRLAPCVRARISRKEQRSRVNASQWYQFRNIILIFLEGGFNDSLFIRGLRLGKTQQRFSADEHRCKNVRERKEPMEILYNGTPCSYTPRSGYTQLTGLCTKEATIRVRRIRRCALHTSTEITGPSLRKKSYLEFFNL